MFEVWKMTLFEWKTVRSKRGLILYTLFFACACVAISYFGSVSAGYERMQGLKETGISLLNFSLLFIPLMALLCGATSFIDQRDSWELICTQPLSMFALMIGKYFGQSIGMMIPIVIGFGSSAIVIAVYGSLAGWREFLLLLVMSLLTAVIFLAVSFLLVALSKRSSRVYGWAFAVWTALLLFYDMLVIGVVVLTTGPVQKTALWTLLLLNPADMVRIVGISQMGSYEAISATGNLVQQMMAGTGVWFLVGSLIIWWLGCLFLSIFVTRSQDLVSKT